VESPSSDFNFCFCNVFILSILSLTLKGFKIRKCKTDEKRGGVFLFDADYLFVMMKFISAVMRARIPFQKKEKRICHLID